MRNDNDTLQLRPAASTDLPELLDLFDQARRFMRESGNPDQWKSGYPDASTLLSDIDAAHLYVITRSADHAPDSICGAFALIPGQDPTYARIDGQWLREAPYVTLHRCVSDGSVRGLFDMMVDFAAIFGVDIRIDTHERNLPMQRAILRNGFRCCGTIYLANGAPRLAYQRLAAAEC